MTLTAAPFILTDEAKPDAVIRSRIEGLYHELTGRSPVAVHATVPPGCVGICVEGQAGVRDVVAGNIVEVVTGRTVRQAVAHPQIDSDVTISFFILWPASPEPLDRVQADLLPVRDVAVPASESGGHPRVAATDLHRNVAPRK